MSKLDELKASVSVVEGILKECVSKASIEEKVVGELQVQKNSLQIDIDKLKKEVSEIKELKSGIVQRLREKEAEVDAIKSSYLNKVKYAENDSIAINKEREELAKKADELSKGFELLKTKQKQANERLTEANSKLAISNEVMLKADALVSSILDTEKSIVSRENSLNEKLSKAENKHKTALELWHGASQLKEKSELLITTNEALKVALSKKEAEVSEKELYLHNFAKELEKKEEEIKYNELRVNKIIKDAKIEALIGRI